MSTTRSHALAFPSDCELDVPKHQGLTKREYFAAQAMKGFLANPATGISGTNPRPVEKAVKFADKLVLELQET